MTRRFFITATGTDIGKTLVTTALCWQLRQQGHSVHAIKPVISGYEEAEFAASDSGKIAAALGLGIGEIDHISPWRFKAPLAPSMAAAKEGKTLSLEDIVAFCTKARKEEFLLIEGVGGVMVPLNSTHTVLDWMEATGDPVILVAGSYLGSISHTLTALYALAQRGIAVCGVVVSESAHTIVPLGDTVDTLAAFSGHIPILPLPRLDERPNLWKYSPDLTRLITGS